MNILKYPINCINFISQAMGDFASTFYLFIVFFTTCEVFMRYIFNNPTDWVFETCIYLSGAAICMAGPYVTKEQTHISITTILDQLPKKIQKIIKTFNLLFACIVCFVVSYACLPWGWAALLNGETSGTGMDSYGPALVKPMVGFAALIMGFQFIVNMINFLKEDNEI